MGVGIQVFQENGEVTLDLKRRLSKVVGVTVLSGTVVVKQNCNASVA